MAQFLIDVAGAGERSPDDSELPLVKRDLPLRLDAGCQLFVLRRGVPRG